MSNIAKETLLTDYNQLEQALKGTEIYLYKTDLLVRTDRPDYTNQYYGVISQYDDIKSLLAVRGNSDSIYRSNTKRFYTDFDYNYYFWLDASVDLAKDKSGFYHEAIFDLLDSEDVLSLIKVIQHFVQYQEIKAAKKDNQVLNRLQNVLKNRVVSR